MSKQTNKASQKPQRASLLLPALVAFAILALAVGAIVMSMSPDYSGEGPSGRPYIGGDLHSLAVDPTDPERVMVGGHDGGAISDDGGKTWRQASGLEGADPMGWVIDPRDPSKMYAGGHPGFYRSEDGGKTWSQDNSGLPGTDIHGLGMDPQNPDVLYAYVVGQGLYRSPDAGHRWELVSTEFDAMGPILVDPHKQDTLYLAAMDSSFRRSSDGGKTWQRLGTIPGEMVMSSSQDQQNPDTFYAAGGGVFKSTNGGKSWRPAGEGLPGGVSVVAVAPSNPRIVYAGVIEGDTASVFRSDDGGESWEARN